MSTMRRGKATAHGRDEGRSSHPDVRHASKLEPSGVVLAKLADEVSDGVYNWTRFKGSGPMSGTATELNSSAGIPADIVVVLHRAESKWWFFFPIEGCPSL